jgi:integration host factor subunit beta
MATVTKKELIDRIAEATGEKRVTVKKTVQSFLDNIIVELGKGNRLEFRDFGVFEVKHRAARTAQNPKTLEPVPVPAKRTVKFKVGRMMKQALASSESERAANSPLESSSLPSNSNNSSSSVPSSQQQEESSFG